MDADSVFHQEYHELLTVHQGDGSLVCLGSFLDGSWAEVAGGDDQALFAAASASRMRTTFNWW
jgi:hypothetical protein